MEILDDPNSLWINQNRLEDHLLWWEKQGFKTFPHIHKRWAVCRNFKGLWLKWLNGRKVVANFNPIWQAEGDFEFSSSACCSTLNQLWSSEKKWNNNILTITSWKIRDAWMILQNLSCSQGSSFILRELECWWKFEQLRMKIRFSLYSSAAQLWSLSAFFSASA